MEMEKCSNEMKRGLFVAMHKKADGRVELEVTL